MDAKEAIIILAKMQNYDSKENVEALEIAISALEKVETLEAENARLRELAFNHCSLHGKAFGNTPNYQDMFVDGKCEGYCRGVEDDEPIEDRKSVV